MNNNNFCTSIHCMDGRIQKPILTYIKNNYGFDFVDTITEPGPCKILSEENDKSALDSIDKRIRISIEKHGAKMIFISGHHDCAGNPVSKDNQLVHITKSAEVLINNYPGVKVIKLWINENWKVEELY